MWFFGGGSSGGGSFDPSIDPAFTGPVTIDNDNATGFRVENNGIHDDLIKVDTDTGNIYFGSPSSEYEFGSEPAVTFYHRALFRPHIDESNNRLLSPIIDIDARAGSEYVGSGYGGEHILRFYGIQDDFITGGCSFYFDSGGHMHSGKSISVCGYHNNTAGDGFRYYQAFYTSDGTTSLPSMIEAYSDVEGAAIQSNAGPTALSNGYIFLGGYNNSADNTRTANLLTFAIDKTGDIWLSAGHSPVNNTRPGGHAGFDTSIRRNGVGALKLDGTVNLGGQLLMTDLAAPTSPTLSVIPPTTWAALTDTELVEHCARTSDSGSVWFECTTAGITGVTEPTWDTTPGNTTNDGTVVWTARAKTGSTWGYKLAGSNNIGVGTLTSEVTISGPAKLNSGSNFNGPTVRATFGRKSYGVKEFKLYRTTQPGGFSSGLVATGGGNTLAVDDDCTASPATSTPSQTNSSAITVRRCGQEGVIGPATPGSNTGILFQRLNSAGTKQQLCYQFPTGAIQVLATEP